VAAVHLDELTPALLLEQPQGTEQHRLVHAVEVQLGGVLPGGDLVERADGVRLAGFLYPVVDHVAIFFERVPVNLPLLTTLVQRIRMASLLQFGQNRQDELRRQAAFQGFVVEQRRVLVPNAERKPIRVPEVFKEEICPDLQLLLSGFFVGLQSINPGIIPCCFTL